MFKSVRSMKGFTLIELIAVVVVLGILPALAVPTFSNVKQSAANQIATRSAESVVNNAKALAAFNGASLNDSYVDQAGAELGVKYASGNNTITITSGGKTAVATINATTGAITVGDGEGGNEPGVFLGEYSFSTASGDLGVGSCFYYNANWANHTSNDIGFSCTSAAFQSAVATLSAGSQVRITMDGSAPVMYTVASVDLTSTTPLWINFTTVLQNQSYSGVTVEF